MYNSNEMSQKEQEFATIVMEDFGFTMDLLMYLADVNNDSILMIDNKPIKCATLKRAVSRDEIQFNPLRNMNLISKLFAYYLSNASEDYGIYVKTYYPIFEAGDGFRPRYFELVYIKDNIEDIIRTESYYNDALCYAELASIINQDHKTFHQYEGE
jgi:hypothetical protein